MFTHFYAWPNLVHDQSMNLLIFFFFNFCCYFSSHYALDSKGQLIPYVRPQKDYNIYYKCVHVFIHTAFGDSYRNMFWTAATMRRSSPLYVECMKEKRLLGARGQSDVPFHDYKNVHDATRNLLPSKSCHKSAQHFTPVCFVFTCVTHKVRHYV